MLVEEDQAPDTCCAAVVDTTDCLDAADLGSADHLAEDAALAVQLLQRRLSLTPARPAAAYHHAPVVADGRLEAEARASLATRAPPAVRVLGNATGAPMLFASGNDTGSDAGAAGQGGAPGISPFPAHASEQLLVEKAAYKWAVYFKYFLVFVFTVVLLVMSCVCYRGRTMKDVDELEGSRRRATDCGGICPCGVKEEVQESDLESWEQSAKDVFAGVPTWMGCPRDLGPRQWTWRVAEINLWIQVIISAQEVYESVLVPRAVLKDLQVAFAVLMLLASLSAVFWIHVRAVVFMLQYVFCTIITKALYVAAKYSVISSTVTACAMSQGSFIGCSTKGPLADCLPWSRCTQDQVEEVGCRAPGADTCLSLSMYMPSAGRGMGIFANDALQLLLFLMGIVPVFMAATARESRRQEPARERAASMG